MVEKKIDKLAEKFDEQAEKMGEKVDALGEQADEFADEAEVLLEQKLKRKKRTSIFMAVVAVLIVAAILYAVFAPHGGGTGGKGTATLQINCNTLSKDLSALKDKTMEKYVPKDGLILPDTEFAIEPDKTTVFDLLTQACMDKEIQIEYNSTPVYGGSYVEGIGYLYEFSAGKYSGWKYTVNGKVPSYSADKVKLKDGDEVVWYYLVDYREEGM